MAQQQIVVDADNLRSEGRSFEAVGEDFLNAVDQMMSQLEALEKGDTPPWGDDDLGEKFGIVYEGLRDGMEESMKSLGTRLGEMGQKLQGMAANHEANESETGGRLDAMGSRVDGLGDGIRTMSRPVY